MYDQYFALWYSKILAPWEGGIADRPPKADPGGLTNRGVTIAVWREQAPKLFGIPGNENTLRQITKEQAIKIAYEVYWKFYAIDKISNPAIKILVADSVWGGGGYKSVGYPSGTYSQRAAQINADAARNSGLFNTMLNRRVAYLKSLDNYEANKNGWLNRLVYGDSTRASILQLAKQGLNTTGAKVGLGVAGLVGLFFIGRAVYKSFNKTA
jgi:lysozyme family protein